MNQQKIMFNKSSLLNLKAELLKKQEEVQEKKRMPEHKVENFKPSPAIPKEDEQDGKKDKISFKERLQAIDAEELETYKKTKAMLEKKAELYEHLSNPAGKSELSSRFLVDFDSKKQLEASASAEASAEASGEAIGEASGESSGEASVEASGQASVEASAETSSEASTEGGTEAAPPEQEQEILDKADVDGDSEWTEFTDCLGRTRKCLKSDLELFKRKDLDLSKNTDEKKETEDDSDNNPPEAPNKDEQPSLMQRTNDYLQSLRDKWEQKERELLAKDRDVHYQDLLFDEARQHGVGYYAFSTDEDERQKQMDELLSRRAETLRAQAQSGLQRQQHEDLLAARLKAANARQRLRAGLPPDDAQENEKVFNAYLMDFLNKQKAEADARANEEERKIKEEMEKERQKLREAYVREWDRGKKGVDDKVKPFKEMSQEEYVEQQRDKRIDEFAPVQSTSSHKSNKTFDVRGKKVSVDEPAKAKTWAEVRPKPKTPPPPDISDYISQLHEQKGLYFSTAKLAQPSVTYRNFVQPQEPVSIDNELSDDDSDNEMRDEMKMNEMAKRRRQEVERAEMPPPPTYNYYAPSTQRSTSQKPFESDMTEAYAQGAKSLEAKPTKRHLPDRYDFTFE